VSKIFIENPIIGIPALLSIFLKKTGLFFEIQNPLSGAFVLSIRVEIRGIEPLTL
jgi:hypothetical protein